MSDHMFYARLASQYSTCDRANVGAVIVKNNKVLSYGYNHNLKGLPNCQEEGHLMRDNHCIATIHAEQDAITYCAREGISTKGASIYVTHFPCLNCAKLIVASGIKAVYFKHKYNVDHLAVQLLIENNIRFVEV